MVKRGPTSAEPSRCRTNSGRIRPNLQRGRPTGTECGQHRALVHQTWTSTGLHTCARLEASDPRWDHFDRSWAGSTGTTMGCSKIQTPISEVCGICSMSRRVGTSRHGFERCPMSGREFGRYPKGIGAPSRSRLRPRQRSRSRKLTKPRQSWPKPARLGQPRPKVNIAAQHEAQFDRQAWPRKRLKPPESGRPMHGDHFEYDSEVGSRTRSPNTSETFEHL